MSFPRYPKYKDSGVEWLGEVPEHWEVTALKRGFEVTLGKMLQPESKAPEDQLLPYLRAANIQWEGVDTTNIKNMWFSQRDRKQLRLEAGDLLVSEGGDVGRSCLWDGELGECYFQNSVNRVRARDGHSNGYLRYWMSTIKDKGYIDVLCNKSTIAHFTAEKVASVPVPLPDPAEQTAIAAFLDRETAKIDGLVQEQRRLMELLKEKRQAVISHAVTKGLNPDAPMKPSGIEWLGDVPEHWEVCALRHSLADVFNGMTATQVDESPSTVPVTRIETISKGVIDTSRLGFIDVSEAREDRLLRDGDILFSNINSLNMIGNCAYCDGSREIYAGMNLLVLRPSTKNRPRWLYWIIRSTIFRQVVESLAKPAINQASISQSSINGITIAVPPEREQEAITEYLDSETTKLDTLTAEAQRAIDLLQERRTALISAAVTGQIDVRKLVTTTN